MERYETESRNDDGPNPEDKGKDKEYGGEDRLRNECNMSDKDT